MRQSYMILNGIKYAQGTIFVIKEDLQEKRMMFLYYIPDKNRYLFLFHNNVGTAYRTSFPDTRFMNNFIRIDQPTERESKKLQSILREEELQRRESKKWRATDLDVFFLILLMIAVIAVFPPAAIIICFIAFAYKQK